MAKTEIDVAIGARVRRLRNERGMSQSDIARVLGLTFQQVQKYENGTNRISGSRLVTVAKILKVPVSMIVGENETAEEAAAVTAGGAMGKIDYEIARLSSRLAEHNPAGRRIIRDLMVAMLPGEAVGA